MRILDSTGVSDTCVKLSLNKTKICNLANFACALFYSVGKTISSNPITQQNNSICPFSLLVVFFLHDNFFTFYYDHTSKE